jgi:lysine biosynthesis protein LysW
MAFAYCPDCAERIYLGSHPWVGQPITCDRCDADLEVTDLKPPVLDLTDDLLSEDWVEDSKSRLGTVPA